MSKRKETLQIEDSLRKLCKEKRWYGCEEVTIGFYNNGHGNEIVDFCIMDSKGVLRCYEIKVTLSDLKSKAKKSWYGHYNYLVLTRELYEKAKDDLDTYIPDYVGVLIPCNYSWSNSLVVTKKPKKQQLSMAQEQLLEQSLVRSMYYKIEKYRDANNLEVLSKLKSDLRKEEKENDRLRKENSEYFYSISRFERLLRLYYGLEIDLFDFINKFTKGLILLPNKLDLRLTQRGEERNEKNKKIIEEENE